MNHRALLATLTLLAGVAIGAATSDSGTTLDTSPEGVLQPAPTVTVSTTVQPLATTPSSPPPPEPVDSTTSTTPETTIQLLPEQDVPASEQGLASTGPAVLPDVVVPDESAASAIVAALAPWSLPSDCTFPIDNPESLPNASRSYRSGVHQGIDFICLEPGRSAIAAADGRVVMAVDGYDDASPADRSAVLDIAAGRGSTPPFTLAMLYGNFVVLDHGNIANAGHVVSVYAHLDTVDESISTGVAVTAGQRLGEIGNRGTSTASSGGTRPQSIHLHWEVIVDDVYVGAGLSASDTRELYRQLFDL